MKVLIFKSKKLSISVWPPASSVVGCLCLGLVVVLAGLVAARTYRRRRAREKMARIRYYYNTLYILRVFEMGKRCLCA